MRPTLTQRMLLNCQQQIVGNLSILWMTSRSPHLNIFSLCNDFNLSTWMYGSLQFMQWESNFSFLFLNGFVDPSPSVTQLKACHVVRHTGCHTDGQSCRPIQNELVSTRGGKCKNKSFTEGSVICFGPTKATGSDISRAFWGRVRVSHPACHITDVLILLMLRLVQGCVGLVCRLTLSAANFDPQSMLA